MNDDFKEELKDCYARIEQLEAALREYVEHCPECKGNGAKLVYDTIIDKHLLRDCAECEQARAALEECT
jgi:hypothetical protein